MQSRKKGGASESFRRVLKEGLFPVGPWRDKALFEHSRCIEQVILSEDLGVFIKEGKNYKLAMTFWS